MLERCVIVKSWILLALFVALFPEAQGASSYGFYTVETPHLLSIGAGVSSPSTTRALYENPAGLIFNQGAKVMGSAGSESSKGNPRTLGAALYGGNGTLAGAVGVRSENQTPAKNTADVGGAFALKSLDMAFGAAGIFTNGSPADGNAGFLFNPSGPLRLGGAVRGLQHGADDLQGGASLDPNPFVTVSLDGSTNRNVQGTALRASLGVHEDIWQFTGGYGFELDTKAASAIRKGSVLGLGVRLGGHVHLQAYFQQFEKYFAAVTFRF